MPSKRTLCFNVLSSIKKFYYIMSSARNRAIVFSMANMVVKLLEIGLSLAHILNDGIDSFLDIPWKFVFTLFGLRILPAILGIVLFFSILSNDANTTYRWCILEISVMLLNLWTCIPFGLHAAVTTTENVILLAYSLFRIIGFLIIYHYWFHADSGKFENIIGFDSGCYKHKPTIFYTDKYMRKEVGKLEMEFKKSQTAASILNTYTEILMPNIDSNLCSLVDAIEIMIHKYSLRP